MFLSSTIFLHSQIKFVDSGDANFKPIISSFAEPKVGVMKYLNRGSIKVDIGNSVDLIMFTKDSIRITLGIDFFAYALANNYGVLLLRVEVLDGFFGGNLTIRRERFSLRFRVLHRSAHFVDEYSHAIGLGRGRSAMSYTREFGDLISAYEVKNLRLYLGLNYAFRSKPRKAPRFYAQTGVELFRQVGRELFGSPIVSFFSYDVKLISGRLNHSLMFGVKFGRWRGRGVIFYLNYYSGFDFYGQYFDIERKFWGSGFLVDF
jgi:hypothetical protein